MNPTIVSYFFDFPAIQRLHEWSSQALGFDTVGLMTYAIYLAGAIVIVNAMALVGGMGTFAERKISADIQARIGPNRVGPYGLFQIVADGIKMLTKEDIHPKNADTGIFYLAPLLCVVGVFGTLAVVPFSSGLALSHLNVGVFFAAAVSSFVGLGVFLGGYASNSKWSLLGGMRGAAQIVSYEIPVGISILMIVLMSGTLSFYGIIEAQGAAPWKWYIFHNPFAFIGFFVFFIGVLAETNRAPFDLPEAESELVSGYHTEYTGMRFGFFALAEYIEIFVVCAAAAAFFLGGYHVPFALGGDGPLGQLLEVAVIVTKTLLLYYVVIWIRWTLPRLRVDQMMSVCWKYLTPIAIFNLVGAAIWITVFDDHSILELLTAGGDASHGGGH